MTLRIRKIRAQKGLNQTALSEVSGVRVATISEIENGRGNPRLDTLQAIAKALGVSPLDLFEPSEERADVLALAERLAKLDNKTRMAIETLIRSAHFQTPQADQADRLIEHTELEIKRQ